MRGQTETQEENWSQWGRTGTSVSLITSNLDATWGDPQEKLASFTVELMCTLSGTRRSKAGGLERAEEIQVQVEAHTHQGAPQIHDDGESCHSAWDPLPLA